MSNYFHRAKTPKTNLLNLMRKLVGKDHFQFVNWHQFNLPRTQQTVRYQELYHTRNW